MRDPCQFSPGSGGNCATSFPSCPQFSFSQDSGSVQHVKASNGRKHQSRSPSSPAKQAPGQAENTHYSSLNSDPFFQLAEMLPELLWTCSPDGKCDYFNARWTRFTGKEQADLLGDQWRDCIHLEDREATCSYWFSALKGEVPYNIQYRLRRQDGQFHWFKVRAAPLRDAQGKIVKWFGVCTDVEDLKEMEQHLEAQVAERTARLGETMREMEAFSYSVSHDLRAPLRAINGFAHFLISRAGQQLSPELNDVLQRIIANTHRAEALIRDVLDYSKVARTEMPLTGIDLETLVRNTIANNPEFEAAQSQIHIRPRLPQVLANRPLLEQSIINLLSNALKFVPPGTTPDIHLWAEFDESRARLWIEDNGIGVSKDEAELIFTPFKRGKSAAEFEGAGIGLAIVRKAIERMGGSVGVVSNPVRGSRFWLELTLAKGPAAEGNA